MGFSLPDERRKIFRKGKKLEIHVRSLNVASEPATYSYTPYGVTTTSTSVSGSDRLNPFKYTSRQELVVGGDSGTRPNLYHYRSRAYLPEIAHFAQVDGFPGFMFRPASINKYMYVEGGPIVYIDPFGFYEWDTGDFVGTTAGGAAGGAVAGWWTGAGVVVTAGVGAASGATGYVAGWAVSNLWDWLFGDSDDEKSKTDTTKGASAILDIWGNPPSGAPSSF